MDSTFQIPKDLQSLENNNLDVELLQIFIAEYEQLMELYLNSLNELNKFGGDKEKAFTDLFRVFHTLKGDSAYFPDFAEFSKFVSEQSETLRDIPAERHKIEGLIKTMKFNYLRLSGILDLPPSTERIKIGRFSQFLSSF